MYKQELLSKMIEVVGVYHNLLRQWQQREQKSAAIMATECSIGCHIIRPQTQIKEEAKKVDEQQLQTQTLTRIKFNNSQTQTTVFPEKPLLVDSQTQAE